MGTVISPYLKTRNDLLIETIIKLTEKLYDEDGIAINTFEEISHDIIPINLKKKLTKKILMISIKLSLLEMKIFLML